MGRLLDALKRLESEMPAKRPVDPIVAAESQPAFTPRTSQTAVLQPPVEKNADLFAEIESLGWFSQPSGADCQSAHEIGQVGNLPHRDVAAEIDDLPQLLDEELPLRNEAMMNATFDRTESALATADVECPAPLPQGERILRIVPTPGFNNDPGVFGAMARNILAQLTGAGSAALFFTSPTDGEGKTETILPLAEALVEHSGRRAILVDANLHRPDLTREWRFSSRRGIFDVLTGEADWWEAVQETGLSKLSILLNNGLPRRNARLSQPLAFSELLENLKKEYRLVLIDAASLAHAESVSMVRYCRGVYLVVRLGHSSRRTIREASQVIAQAGGKLLGCIAVGHVLAPA